MSESKIKSLEKNIKKAQADKAKAPDFKKLSFAKKIKEYKKELAALRIKNKSPNKPGSGLGIKHDPKKNRLGVQSSMVNLVKPCKEPFDPCPSTVPDIS